MKRYFFLLSVLLIILLACRPANEPIAVTRVVETAVAPTSLPSPTPLTLSTATPAPPTWTATATSVPATWTPTAVTTPTPAISLSEFLTSLQDKLNARDFEALQGMMPAHFLLGTHPSHHDNPAATNAVEFLAYSYVPWVEPAIVIHEENILAHLTEPFAVETIFRGEQNITAVPPSSGWGQGGKGEAILYISVQDGVYHWAGLLAAQEYYIAPELEVMAPPPGLIYKKGSDLWRVSQAGEPEYMATFNDTLSFNPSGTLALHADTSDHQLTLLHLPNGERETIVIEGTLLHGSWEMPWLDEATAILIVGPPNEPADQQSMGNLAALNVLNGILLTLPPILSIYYQPSVAVNSGILYDSQDGVRLWRDDAEYTIDFDHTLIFEGTEHVVTYLGSPVMSPDGRYVVGISSGEYGRYTFAYVLVELNTQTSRFIHFFVPTPADSVLPWGIHWSPDSQWLALDPPSGDFFANSIQLVSVINPDDSVTLPGVTSTPFWLDGYRLIFKRFVGDRSRWQYMDRMTGEQFWLDLPDGAEVVHYVPSN